jgi:hypothetical protein
MEINLMQKKHLVCNSSTNFIGILNKENLKIFYFFKQI